MVVVLDGERRQGRPLRHDGRQVFQQGSFFCLEKGIVTEIQGSQSVVESQGVQDQGECRLVHVAGGQVQRLEARVLLECVDERFDLMGSGSVKQGGFTQTHVLQTETRQELGHPRQRLTRELVASQHQGSKTKANGWTILVILVVVRRSIIILLLTIILFQETLTKGLKSLVRHATLTEIQCMQGRGVSESVVCQGLQGLWMVAPRNGIEVQHLKRGTVSLDDGPQCLAHSDCRRGSSKTQAQSVECREVVQSFQDDAGLGRILQEQASRDKDPFQLRIARNIPSQGGGKDMALAIAQGTRQETQSFQWFVVLVVVVLGGSTTTTTTDAMQLVDMARFQKGSIDDTAGFIVRHDSGKLVVVVGEGVAHGGTEF